MALLTRACVLLISGLNLIWALIMGGHYGSAREDTETNTAASLLWASGLKVITRYQLQLKAGMPVDGTQNYLILEKHNEIHHKTMT